MLLRAVGLPLIKLVASALVFVVLVLHIYHSEVAEIHIRGFHSASLETAPERVKVEFYMEALCIGCQNFMFQQLHPTYELLGDAVMDLHVVPFGNSEIDLVIKQVTCQHGPAECDANTYEQCATHVYPYASRYLPFLYCLDNSLTMGYSDELIPRHIFAECARHSALDFASIAACHDDSKQAWKLQRRAAERTPKEHNYVPWVVINGHHTMDEENDSLLDLVCKAYRKGGGRHPACQDSFFTGALTVRKARKYASDATTGILSES